MSATQNIEYYAFLKFGLHVPSANRQEVIKLIKSNPTYKDDFENIKNNLKTMLDEDQFLEAINSSHLKIAQIPQNAKVIQMRDRTFQIRSINPENIQSLTERAFFNSFNLERIVLNDLEEENYYRESQKNIKIDDYRKEKQTKRTFLADRQQQQQKDFKKQTVNDEQQKCICGKIILDSYWIQCRNERKCRGTGWYHLQCAGISCKDPQQVQKIDFICDFCKRDHEDEKASESSNKKFKTN